MPKKSAVSLKEAKNQFKALLASLNEIDKSNFLEFVFEEFTSFDNVSSSSDEDSVNKSIDGLLDDPVAALNSIANVIKTQIPLDAILPSEIITSPETGENSDCLPDFTVHVDDFLYDEDEVEELVEEGKLKRNYCKDCGSKNIEPLIFISHSLSRDALYYVFSVRLPILGSKTILDIGSRLGAVLYGAYYFTDANRIIGVEMNQELCDLQNKIVQKYKMQNRIEIHHNRIEKVEHLIEDADVIVINNAFEFYNSEEKQVEIWEFLKSKIRKGTLLVVCPHLETTFKNLKPNIVLKEWVKPYTLNVGSVHDSSDAWNDGCDGSEYPDQSDIAFYEVL